MYLGRKVGLFRPRVEFAVRVVNELAQAQGESKGPLNPRCTPYLLSHVLIFAVFEPKKQGEIDYCFIRQGNT